MTKTQQNNEKLIAGLSYIIVGLIWYLLDETYKKNEFVKFHVKQGLNLLIIAIILNSIIGLLTFITFGLFGIIGWVFEIILLIIWILAIVNVINGEKKEVLIIGQFAEQYLKF